MTQIKRIYNELELQNILCDNDFSKLLKNYSNEELKIFFPLIKQMIENNQKEQIYSDYIKGNLYNILGVIREKSKDIEILEEVNNLISILNQSGTENVYRTLYGQFYVRFYRILGRKTFNNVNEDNIHKAEYAIYRSMNQDSVIFTSLICDTADEFTNKYLGGALNLTSVSYLLYTYPEILQDDSIRYKLLYFLYSVREMFKVAKNKELDQQKASIFDGVKNQANYCLKLIKKKV